MCATNSLAARNVPRLDPVDTRPVTQLIAMYSMAKGPASVHVQILR
jgi:hypothetical protein